MYYAVSLFFKSSRNGLIDGKSLWEESIYLIEADSEDVARSKAMQIGKEQEHCYKNSDNQDICWIFDSVYSLFLIENGPRDGNELFSRFLRSSEVDSLKKNFD